MNSTREIESTEPKPPLPATQQRVLASLLAEGALLRKRRTRRRMLAGTGIAACAVALGWAVLLVYPHAASVVPVVPGGAAAPDLAAVPAVDATVKPDGVVVANGGKGQGAGTNSGAGSGQVATVYDAVWKTAHNRPGGFKAITTDELLARINVDGRSFGVVETAGSVMIVSNDRGGLNTQ